MRRTAGPASVVPCSKSVVSQKNIRNPHAQAHVSRIRNGKQNTDVSGLRLDGDVTVISEMPGLVVHPKQEPYQDSPEKLMRRGHMAKTRQSNSIAGESCSLQLAQCVLDDLLQELVCEVADAVFRTAMRDFVDTYLAEVAVRQCAADVLSEVVQLLLPRLVEEAQTEMALDDVIESELLPEVIAEEARAVALSELAESDTQVTIKQLTQVMHYANNRLMDTFLMGHLVELVANQGRCFAEMDQSGKLLDGWMLDVLSLQLFNELRLRNITMENVPLRNYHRHVFTDIVLDVMLSELTESLDEDMEHRLEYERKMEER
ncbi:hypothetical protein MATL_G00043080 [Megalops atlanticus]|uniref:Uncharacterized protein n=1 Tax=Megalops atlanticus TaxID=7932 RepID=A0A9D3QBE1_MEGAT|nr:hypothetical protein MATL_G00043080 [Megalops atlanticus]